MLARYLCQHVAHGLQLPFAHKPAIGAAPGCAGVVSEIVHVIEQDEGGAGMLEGIVARPEHALPGLARDSVVPGLWIDVVIAGAMVPRDARCTQQLQVAWVE